MEISLKTYLTPEEMFSTPGVECLIKICEEFAKRCPLTDYRIRVVWAKIDCRWFPFCFWPVLSQLPKLLGCDCKLEHLKCERCGNKGFRDLIVHHKAYCQEAIPSDRNKRWLKHYKLLCQSCHRIEHYNHPEFNNRKLWKGIIDKVAEPSNPVWLEEAYFENLALWKREFGL